MKGKSHTTNESIRVEAYLLSEKAGHPTGMEHYFWTQAEAVVQARATAVSVAVKKAAVRSKATATAKTKATAKAKPIAQPKTGSKTKGKPEAAVKPKVTAKKPGGKPAPEAVNGKEHQLSLDGGVAAPARKRATRK